MNGKQELVVWFPATMTDISCSLSFYYGCYFIKEIILINLIYTTQYPSFFETLVNLIFYKKKSCLIWFICSS